MKLYFYTFLTFENVWWYVKMSGYLFLFYLWSREFHHATNSTAFKYRLKYVWHTDPSRYKYIQSPWAKEIYWLYNKVTYLGKRSADYKKIKMINKATPGWGGTEDREMSFYLRERNYPNHTTTKSQASATAMLGTYEAYASYLTISKPLKFSRSFYYMGRDWLKNSHLSHINSVRH